MKVLLYAVCGLDGNNCLLIHEVCACVWCGCVQYERDECRRHFESTSFMWPRPQGLLLLMLFCACCLLISNVSLTVIYQYVTLRWKFCKL